LDGNKNTSIYASTQQKSVKLQSRYHKSRSVS